jgi:hypothetical protein
MESNGEPDASATGVLLYPDSGRSLSAKLRISGHAILARTVDLDQPWGKIEQALLSLAAEARAEARSQLSVI